MMAMTATQIRAEAIKRRRSTSEPLSSSHLDRCRADPAHFICTHIVIDNTQPGDDDADTAAMPFHLWTAQTDLLTDIVNERLILILKARQLGISWLVCAYALWLCLFRPGRLVLMFSIGQSEADEMLRRISVMYHRLPADLKAALPALGKENTSEMAWANGSRVESLPSTKKAGSGYTASLVILDEFAKNQWARELYTAVKPTIDGGGKMIVLSSAQGTGNLFHELCEKALKGLGRFAFRFLPWWARPGRDEAWYAATEADAISSALMRQEYPASPEEAFEATNTERFIPSLTWWDSCKEDLPPLDNRTPLILALDAGEVSDTFAAVAVSRHPTRRDDLAVRYVRCWIPPGNGEALDFDAIEEELREFIKSHRVLQLCFDRYQLRQMTQRLSRIVWCEEFSQGADRLEADKKLLDMIQMKAIAHDGDPMLRQHIANADRRVEAGGQRLRIVKRSQGEKIDLTVACAMACHRAHDGFAM